MLSHDVPRAQPKPRRGFGTHVTFAYNPVFKDRAGPLDGCTILMLRCLATGAAFRPATCLRGTTNLVQPFAVSTVCQKFFSRGSKAAVLARFEPLLRASLVEKEQGLPREAGACQEPF